MRVLVLEDDPPVLRGIVRVLTSLGHQTVAARTVGEAVAALDADAAVDVILADVGLGGGETGMDLLRHAHAREHRARRVLISGALDDWRGGEGDVVQRFAAKPLGRAELAELIREG